MLIAITLQFDNKNNAESLILSQITFTPTKKNSVYIRSFVTLPSTASLPLFHGKNNNCNYCSGAEY